jgi:hypothetical protein
MFRGTSGTEQGFRSSRVVVATPCAAAANGKAAMIPTINLLAELDIVSPG